jgi:broad specificity phosphatase PhoE
MGRIYIRHADKAYNNGDHTTDRHDPPITNSGANQARLLAEFLIQTYGLPEAVVCSPYRRTRETAIAMVSAIVTLTGRTMPIKCDVDLSEYLGNHPNDPLDITDGTRMFSPPHPERFPDLDRRLRRHNRIMQVLDATPAPVWFICHGIIITQLARLNGVTRPTRRISPLGCFLFTQSRSPLWSQPETQVIPVSVPAGIIIRSSQPRDHNSTPSHETQSTDPSESTDGSTVSPNPSHPTVTHNLEFRRSRDSRPGCSFRGARRRHGFKRPHTFTVEPGGMAISPV